MGWKFWESEKTNDGEVRLPGPQSIPDLVARYLVTEEKKEPDWAWNLKAIVRPTEKKDAFYCRVFSSVDAAQAGVKVINWTSLDGHPDLVLWEGYFDKATNKVHREKYAKH